MALLVAGGLFVILGLTLNPGFGVALMMLQTALILGNAYRFKTIAHGPKQEAESVKEDNHSYQKFKHAFGLGKQQSTLVIKDPVTRLDDERENNRNFIPTPVPQHNLSNRKALSLT